MKIENERTAVECKKATKCMMYEEEERVSGEFDKRV